MMSRLPKDSKAELTGSKQEDNRSRHQKSSRQECSSEVKVLLGKRFGADASDAAPAPIGDRNMARKSARPLQVSYSAQP